MANADIQLIAGMGVGAAIWGFGLWNLADNARRAHRLVPAPWQAAQAPKVSIILPARNEAHQIRRCVDSLLAQDYPDFELIVVDDRSEDDTRAILEAIATGDSRLRVVSGAELPAGWMGKSWANHQGVQYALGEWLMFTDADTWHHPSGLSTFVSFATTQGADMTSTAPFLECQSFWENVVQPGILLATLMFKPLRRLENPRIADTLANGQYVLIRRSIYDQVGGHEAIRTSVVDDISLATRVQQSGAILRLPVGAPLVHVRMYTNFGEIWQGWSKNFFGAIKANLFLACLGPVVWFLSAILPWFCLPYFAWQAIARPGDSLVLTGLALSGGIVLGSMVVRRLATRTFCDQGLLWTLSTPLTYAMLSLFMLNSIRRALLGRGPQWKGRVYPGMHT